MLQLLQMKDYHHCARVSFSIKLQAEACNFIKKETLAQVFSCEFRKISKNPRATSFERKAWNVTKMSCFLSISQGLIPQISE